MPKSSGATRERRIMLWELQGRRCAGCGERAYSHLPKKHMRSLTIDEAVPRSKGGMRVLGNQLVMHQCCNLKKADRMPNGCEKIWLEMVNAKLRMKGKVR